MIPQIPGKYNKFSVNILRRYIIGTAHAFLSKLLPSLCKGRWHTAAPLNLSLPCAKGAFFYVLRGFPTHKWKFLFMRSVTASFTGGNLT